jgi:SAM-dependent methyltransferase
MNGIDFGYPWWLSYGHLVVFVCAVGLLFLVQGRVSRVLVGLLVIWSFVSFVVLRFVININGRAAMPTQAFIEQGRVLDLGAGTGRSSVMVLEARPKVSLVALDLFGESFGAHFGKTETGEQRLLANLKAAGVEGRASIVKHDMRDLPFGAGEFDGVVSAYAVDHLGRVGINKTLREAARVLKPGGEFLLILIGKDFWLQFTFGPLLAHSGARDGQWWRARMEEAGFQVMEQGMKPGTLYLVGKKR